MDCHTREKLVAKQISTLAAAPEFTHVQFHSSVCALIVEETFSQYDSATGKWPRTKVFHFVDVPHSIIPYALREGPNSSSISFVHVLYQPEEVEPSIKVCKNSFRWVLANISVKKVGSNSPSLTFAIMT